MLRANAEVAALLRQYAELLSITGADAFRVRSYEKAARAIGGYHVDVSTVDTSTLRAIPGVGRSIADKVAEFVRTGTIAEIERARATIPDGVRELTKIPTLGPRKALLLHEKLGISSVDELAAAIEGDKLAELPGFGAKTQANIAHGIELLRAARGRVPIDVATDIADELVAALSTMDECQRCEYAGSLRRCAETIGDIDILAASTEPESIMTAFVALPMVREVIVSGQRKTSIRTADGVQVDLRVVPPASWGAALQYFTGSKEHNVRIRELAVHKGLKLSEYGLFDDTGELIAAETEEQVYRRLGLSWIAPPLREDRGEITAADRDELPNLVVRQDIRGDLHTHTDLTDGVASLSDMINAAERIGHEYYAVTDHAPNLIMQRMTDEKMLAQREQLRQLAEDTPMTLLHGTELNIAPAGDVDWPAEFLAGFDICVASVHSHFDQPRAEMTRRFLRAIENPQVNVIGHPSTRKLGRRGPVDVDWDAVFAACARTGTALEINSSPSRLDLNDENILAALRFGVKFAINSDAHSVPNLDVLRYGVGTAQRGWLTADDVINTWPLDRLRQFLNKR
ncbi:MAG: DNA polymerase/3'-5' exonuclease PolX [Sciscionella sp.]|nr:DNA polymerase/3'-5' exonuclease PolX [Sciscionella sp.]